MATVEKDEEEVWVAAIDVVIHANEPERHLSRISISPSAIHSLNNAVRSGHKTACCLLGMCHLKIGTAPKLGEFFEASAERGIELLQQSADADYVPAIYQLAECYRMGIGVTEEASKAIELLTKISEAPHSFHVAQRQLGIMYYDGVGTERDYHKAVHWFQQASQQDDIEAVVRLGVCYQLGVGGLEKSMKHAMDMYEVARNKGHPFAYACIGRAYECGEGQRWDPTLALKHYETAAEGGDALGRVGAAWLLLTGGGGWVTVDKPRAQRYLTDAADAECKEAQYLLSQYHLNPQMGGKVDIKKGMDFLNKASSGSDGLMIAKYMLAQAYQNGLNNVSVDMKKALALYEEAAAQGHETSKKRADAIQKQMQKDAEEEEGGGNGKKKGKKK